MIRLLAAASFAVIGLAACTQAEPEKTETKVVEVPGPTVVETREVQAPAVVVERDTPPVVIERDRRGDSTTVRAGPDGVEVETTNR
ncbi:MAG TPA: hypothetical protein VGE54_03050 [Brevundimonas sp.]